MTGPAPECGQLELAIAAQEALRGVVDDDIVDAAVAALRERLATSELGLERRRQVTVLFADVSGFTAMSARLDAEVVAAAMNALWARLDAIVTDLGGRVDKHIGDAIMAVWGVSSTREDDPERAVRAGLAMQEELAARVVDEPLTMRIGVNTGAAHVGRVGAGGEVTVIGDTVNVASRVEELAPPGGLLVTHDTYAQVRGIFDVEPLEPVVLKGKAEATRLYLVNAVKARRFRMQTRGVEGVETRMVGRERELALLQAAFDTAVTEPRTQRVTVIGDAGIGKSRLLYEFENWIELHPEPAYFFKGRALAIRRSAPFGLLRDVLADRFDILDSDPPDTVAAKLREGLAPELHADEADVVGQWIGFDLRTSAAVAGLLGSGQLAAAARAHLFRYVESLAHADPVVVFLEDMHWADEESVGLVDELVAHVPDAHLLVVGVGRPTLLERPECADLVSRSTLAMVLQPLDAAATRQLVDEILRRVGDVPAELTELVVGRADGNAFYVEELIKMLIDDGVIEVGTAWEEWQLHADRLSATHVPATLTGVLQTRLDALTHDDRAALQRSSVVGRVFWDGAVAALGNTDADRTTGSLEVARQRELIYRNGRSAFGDAIEYTFKHALLRDVAYETVLLRDRRQLHHLAAEWLRHHAGPRAGEYSALIATHLRAAGDLGDAADLLYSAAVASMEAGNSAAARRTLDEAFELWTESGQEAPPDALATIAEACVRLGEIEASRRHADEALARASSPAERAEALFLRSWVAAEQGDHVRERAMLDQALPIAEETGGLLLVRVLSGLAWNELQTGDPALVPPYADRARELAGALGHPLATREVLALAGVIAGMTGEIETSIARYTEGLDTAESIGDLEGQALARMNLGVAHHLLGDRDGSDAAYQAALDHYDRAVTLNRQLGRALQNGMTCANIAQVHIRLGDDAAARRLLREAITLVQRSGGTAALLFCVLAEADRRITRGDTPGGLELIALVDAHPARTRDSTDEIDRIVGRAGLAPYAGEVDVPADEAEQRLLDAVARFVDELVGPADEP